MSNPSANAYAITLQRVQRLQRVQESFDDALRRIRESSSSAELVAISLSLAEESFPIKSARKRYETAALILRGLIGAARTADTLELVSRHAKEAAIHTRKVQELLTQQLSDLAPKSPVRTLSLSFEGLSAVAEVLDSFARLGHTTKSLSKRPRGHPEYKEFRAYVMLLAEIWRAKHKRWPGYEAAFVTFVERKIAGYSDWGSRWWPAQPSARAQMVEAIIKAKMEKLRKRRQDVMGNNSGTP
jgi:hypothetical protein